MSKTKRLRRALLVTMSAIMMAAAAYTSYAEDSIAALYTQMQSITWTPEAISCLINDPRIVSDVTVSYMQASGTGQYAVKKFVGASGRYFSNGMKSDEIPDADPGFGFNRGDQGNDISSLYFSAGSIGNYFALKVGRNGYWVICPYTEKVMKPGSPDPNAPYVSEVSDVKSAASKYAKEHGYKAALDYYNPTIGNLVKSVLDSYSSGSTDELLNAQKTEKQKEMEERAKREREEAQAEIENDTAVRVNNTISEKLWNYTFSKPDIDRLIKAGYVTRVAYLQQGPNGKFSFGVTGDCTNAYRKATQKQAQKSKIESLSYDMNVFCALKFKMDLPDVAEVWYIFNFLEDSTEAAQANAKYGYSYDPYLVGSLMSLGVTVGQIKQDYEESSNELVDEYDNKESAVVNHQTDESTVDPNIGLYADREYFEIQLTQDPLEIVSGVDFWNENDAGTKELKGAVAGFYRFVVIVATCGIVLAIGVFAITMIVNGPKQKHEMVGDLAVKIFVFICICGFADLWALFYPIIQSLL